MNTGSPETTVIPLVVLIGAPGSGKSSWAAAHFPRSQVVSSDGLRKVVAGDPNDQRATPYAMKALHAIVWGRMVCGQPTVVDATNTVAEHRAEVVAAQFVPPPAGVEIRSIAVLIDTPRDECLRRNAARRGNRRVPDRFVEECCDRIEEQMPVASTWALDPFYAFTRVRPDGLWYGSGVTRRLLERCGWLAAGRSLLDCPDWASVEALRRPPTVAYPST